MEWESTRTAAVWQRNIGERDVPIWDSYPLDIQNHLNTKFEDLNAENAICKIDGVEHIVAFDRGEFQSIFILF